MPDDDDAADNRAISLLKWFEPLESVVVAFSGGVDSTLVLAAAVRALGAPAVIAATAVSPSLPSGLLDFTQRMTSQLGVTHHRLATDELAVPGYAANGPDRCYFCKATLLDSVLAIYDLGLGKSILTGTNADDVAEGWRPGIRAASEREARMPLAETGLTKIQVRAISRMWKLDGCDRPASPCLSSRVAYGIEISAERLARIDRAETSVRTALSANGIHVYELRVRDLGSSVRVELDGTQVEAAKAWGGLCKVLSDAGFEEMPSTITEFRSGGLNLVLSPHHRFR